MSGITRTKYIHYGQLVAEVEVELLDDDQSWGPYLSKKDALKLDDVRAALRSGNIEEAARFGTVYELHQLASQRA